MVAPLLPADLFDDVEQLANFRGRPVELDDQHGVGRRKSRVNRRFRCFDGERIHHLDRRGNDALGDDLRHGRSTCVDRVERRQQRLHRFRLSQNPDGDARHHGKRTFGADEQAEQIRPRRIGERAAKLHELAVGQHGVERRARGGR